MIEGRQGVEPLPSTQLSIRDGRRRETDMTEHLSEQQLRARADKLIADINYAEQAGLSADMVQRMYDAFDRLNEKATAAGLGPL